MPGFLLPALLLLTACQEAPSGPAALEAQEEEAQEAQEALEAAGGEAPPPRAAAEAPIRVYDAVPVRRFPHERTAFTQGLFFADGALFESTGKRGASRIRRIDLRTGRAAREVALPDEVFGEGATAVDDRIVSLSWRAGRGFVHDLETLEREAEFPINGEGWGLAYDPEADRLVLSDGTPRLRFLDPDTYEETGEMLVTLRGEPVPLLNELEWVEGEIFANVWQQEAIVRIDPETGRVGGLIDVSALYPAAMREDPRDDVANGIAYEPGSGRLFLTGKRWPTLFEVELRERS